MPPRRTASSTVAATTGQTIVPLGELVKTLGYTLVWSPNECYLYDENRQKLPLTTSAGCPQLCEAEALALIAKVENKKLERLQNETATTMDRVQVAAMQMDRRWIDYLRSYVKQDNLEDGVRSLRDSPFLRDLPGECLDGLVQGGVLRDGWKVLKGVDFLNRPQKRHLWGAKRWIVHLCAGDPGHYQFSSWTRGTRQ